ncbi:MAG TPA: hypothetical protein PKM36_11485 [Propionibacteriaceae bacterium]|nr:hypothetical protein [Propionibacteriaceae bacterium]HPZ50364.1 hypothetical protein [Propionibacteriaceae bacterium]HQE33001.1 hypothetical protein [Propionibacteriaceae bacterium]
MTTTTEAARPFSLTLAAGLVWLVALVIAVIGIGSIAQLHGRFSVGVGVMLLAYAALLGWVGSSAWRRRFYSRGMLVGTGLLHLAVALSSISAGNVPVWIAVAAISALTIGGAMAPSTAAALKITSRTDDSEI